MPQLMSGNKQQIDPIAVLKDLLASKDPNNPMQNWQGTANQGANAKPQLDPYQEGVKKALKESGYAHTTDAIQQGVPAAHIVEQAKLSPDQNNPQKMLSDLIASAINGGQQPASTQAQPQMQTQNQAPMVQSMGSMALANASRAPLGNAKILQDQAMGIVNPQGMHPLGMLLNLIGNVSGMSAANQAINSVKLSNISQAQDITGSKPVAETEYLKQAVELAKNGSLQPDQLMTKFEQASQPFITQRDSFARIQSLANDPSPAGDLGLIFSYMKVLDPNSTVREGEQATAQNARAIPDSISNLYNNVMTGGKLTPKQRVDFIKKSSAIFQSAETQQKKTTAEFSRLGKMNGIDPKRFIRDTGLAQDAGVKADETPANNGVQTIGRFQVKVK